MRIFKPDSIPQPRSTAMAPSHKFDLEIGPGVGLHPLHYALANPDRTLVAIERTAEKYEKFLRRYQNHGAPKNLIPIHDDAIHWITHRVDEASLARVFALYPNPEPGNKNQRLAFMPFVDFLHSRMDVDSELIIATNIESYAQECREHLVERGFRLYQDNSPSLPGRTHFEHKYLQRGETCFNLVFKKEEKL